MISIAKLVSFLLFIKLVNCAAINEISSNPTNNLLVGNREITIHHNEMSFEMAANIIGHSTLELNVTKSDDKASDNIKRFMEKEYNGTWFVIVSNNITSYQKVPHVNGTYISFTYKTRTVTALQLNKVSELTLRNIIHYFIMIYCS